MVAKNQNIARAIARATHAYGVWYDSRVWQVTAERGSQAEEAKARAARAVHTALKEAAALIAASMSHRGLNYRNARPYAVGSVLGVKVYRCLAVTTPRGEFLAALAEVVQRAGGDTRQFIVDRLAYEVEVAIWPDLDEGVDYDTLAWQARQVD